MRASSPVRPTEPNGRIDRRYITIGEAAEYLGLNERTVRAMIADGRLTAYRAGRRVVRLRIDEIDAALEPFGGGAV